MDSIFAIETLEAFENVCSQILDNLYNSSCGSITHIEAKCVSEAKQVIKNILSEYQFDLNKITENLNKKSWDQDKVNKFLTLIEQKKCELMYCELNFQISRHGETITGFDWLLKLVLGSSDLKTLRYPLLQLIFSTVSCNGDQKHLVFDVCKDKLLQLINVLEKCID